MDANILTKEQIALLKYIGASDSVKERFYLTGGTPLTAFYLGHRYSEDLDFFSEQEVDIAGLQIFMEKAKRALGITRIEFQQSFNRNLFFIHFNNEVIKTEFTYFPFARIEKGVSQWGIDTDSLLDIAVNKVFTIYQRTKARDYIDLFCICRSKGYTVSDLIKKARIKFDWHIDPIQLGTQFVKAQEAEDMPHMIQEIRKEEWRKFFIEEAKRLSHEVIE